MPGFRFELFGNTPLRELATAVEEQDTLKIVSIVKNEKVNIDFFESKFGQTLLTLALIDNKSSSAKILLSLGADPNIRSQIDNSTPFLTLCRYIRQVNSGLGIISLLINHGADVNAVQEEKQVNPAGRKVTIKNSALQYLISFGAIEDVQLLVEKGTRLDIYPKNGKNSILCTAIFNPRLDILRYLLIDKKASIPDYCYIRDEGKPNQKIITLRDLILDRKEAENIHERELKNEILAYLKEHGH